MSHLYLVPDDTQPSRYNLPSELLTVGGLLLLIALVAFGTMLFRDDGLIPLAGKWTGIVCAVGAVAAFLAAWRHKWQHRYKGPQEVE